MKPLLRGVIPPVVTPLRGRDALDVPGLERVLERLLAGGVHGLFILGTTGEGPSLSPRLQREVVAEACRITAGRVPVLVGVSAASFMETLALARFSAEQGATAIVAAPPFYFPASQADLSVYLKSLVAEQPLPVVLYHIPSVTKIGFELPTVAEAMQEPRILGIKDSSADMIYFQQLLKLGAQRADWSTLVGAEELLGQGTLMGAHGGVPGGANLHPKLYVDVFHAASAGDVARVRALQVEVLKLTDHIYKVGTERTAWIKGLKCALAVLGICEAPMAEPLVAFAGAEREEIRARLIKLGFLSESK